MTETRRISDAAIAERALVKEQMRAYAHRVSDLEAELALVSREHKTMRDALAYVVAWVRHGEGDEATAAELADAALSVSGREDT